MNRKNFKKVVDRNWQDERTVQNLLHHKYRHTFGQRGTHPVSAYRDSMKKIRCSPSTWQSSDARSSADQQFPLFLLMHQMKAEEREMGFYHSWNFEPQLTSGPRRKKQITPKLNRQLAAITYWRDQEIVSRKFAILGFKNKSAGL